MWGYAIFCEYPGCRNFEPVGAEGEIPARWLVVELGVDDPVCENLGTFCGWEHMLATLQKMAPDEALDVRSTPGYADSIPGTMDVIHRREPATGGPT